MCGGGGGSDNWSQSVIGLHKAGVWLKGTS